MRKNLLIILFCSLFTTLHSQQFSGLKVGSYSGIHSIHANPASIRTSNLKWDLSIAGAGLDVSNNLLEFPSTSFIAFYNNTTDQISQNFDEAIKDSDQIESLLGLRFLSNNNSRAHLDLEVFGPGFMIQTSKMSIGVYSKFRAFSHINDIPNFSQSNEISDLTSGDNFDFPESDLSYMDWIEIGLSLSTTLTLDDYSALHLGGNLKKLDAYNVFYSSSNQPTKAIKWQDSLYIENGNFEYALFTGLDFDETSEEYSYDHQKSGSGWAFDLGFIYEWKQSRYSNRNQKIGLSVADIGMINYTAFGHFQQINIDDGFILRSQFLDEHLITELQKELEIEDKELLTFSNQRRIKTPGILQVFYDTPLHNNWNLRISIKENIPAISPVERASVIMATGYYDHKWVGASFPVSLYNHQYLRVGTALRLGPLSFGTDNLIPIFLPTNLRAFNGYIALKLNSEMFSFLKRTAYYKNPKSKQGSSDVKCYEFH